MTKDQAAKQAGCRVYDCALPQNWVDDVIAVCQPKYSNVDLSSIVCSSFVWCYDESKIFGAAFPLTALAEGLLIAYAKGRDQ